MRVGVGPAVLAGVFAAYGFFVAVTVRVISVTDDIFKQIGRRLWFLRREGRPHGRTRCHVIIGNRRIADEPFRGWFRGYDSRLGYGEQFWREMMYEMNASGFGCSMLRAGRSALDRRDARLEYLAVEVALDFDAALKTVAWLLYGVAHQGARSFRGVRRDVLGGLSGRPVDGLSRRWRIVVRNRLVNRSLV